MSLFSPICGLYSLRSNWGFDDEIKYLYLKAISPYLALSMNVNNANIPVSLGDGKETYVNLRWFRGASRYNNGGTNHNGNHRMRLLFGRIKERRKGIN
jgi:hypothetical protein